MKIDILTLFPDMFDALNHSILGKAKDKELIDINIVLFYNCTLSKFIHDIDKCQ